MNNSKRLIEKYGEPISIGAIATKAYFEEERKTYYLKKEAIYTLFDIEVIHTVENVLLDDALLLHGKAYGILSTKGYYTRGVMDYCETIAFEDDFDRSISIKKQSLSQGGCSLPSEGEEAPIDTLARIKTVDATKYTQFALQGAKVPSHMIVIKYLFGVGVGDLIEWGSRKFEILTIENHDERDVLLCFNCIEVL